MTPLTVGVLGIVALFALLALRIPVGIAMILVGTGGISVLHNQRAAMATLGAEAFEMATKLELMVIPFFVLMGNLAAVSGLSRNIYEAAYSWIGHWRGGLASATILGCSGFAALSGSSIASAITMGQVALPEMQRFQYSDRIATGAVAAGGTLGILIPPSTGFVVYAILTEQSIGRLFIAGVVPGVLLTALFIGTIQLITIRDPALAPPGPRTELRDRWIALGRAAPFLVIVAVTIGGIYVGAFTPMEAAGVGAFATFLVALVRTSLSRGKLIRILLASVRTTAMAYLILIGASVFGPFLARSQLPAALAEEVIGLQLGPYGTLLLLLAALVLLGTFLEGFAMLVLTLPIIFPVVLQLGFDPIWFGVLMVVVLEMGLITPPVGINVFVVKSIAPDVPLAEIFRGIFPFWIAMAAGLVLLILFPQLALFLPDHMFGN